MNDNQLYIISQKLSLSQNSDISEFQEKIEKDRL